MSNSTRMMWKNCGSPPSNQSNVTMNMASYGNVEGVGSPPGGVVSLEELMSEQLARELQEEENLQAGLTPTAPDLNQLEGIDEQDVGPICSNLDSFTFDGNDVSSDWLMAQMLQKEYDHEFDREIGRIEKATNKNSKISMSYQHYKLAPGRYDSSSSSDSDVEATEKWELYSKAEKPVRIQSKRACVKSADGAQVTKHDSAICGKRNVCKMENFGPTFSSGDGTGMELKLSNKVYNTLKNHSYSQENRAAKLHEKKDNSTAENAMDAKTKLMILKLVNNGLLDSVGGCVSAGKEANIYHAFGGEGTERIPVVPPEIALKVHKSTLNEFKTRDQYIADDYRFRKHYSKQNPRKIVEQWALKEFLNLEKMKKSDIVCPKVIKVKKNLVIMEFLGEEGIPAPTLKAATLSQKDLLSAFEQSTKCIKDLYRKCKLIHADLSEYNLLWHQSEVYVIDVSQAVDISHPKAHHFLFRDCRNLTSFFKKHLADVTIPETFELFNKITGYNLQEGKEGELESQIDAFGNNQELIEYQTSRTNYPFDYLYDKSALGYSWVASKENAVVVAN